MNVPGQAGAAEAALQRAIDLDPSRADAYYELGLLRARRGDEAQATEALLRATTLKPSLVEAHRALADVARSRGDWPTAIAELEAVLAWEPADVRAREARSVGDRRTGSRGTAPMTSRRLGTARDCGYGIHRGGSRPSGSLLLADGNRRAGAAVTLVADVAEAGARRLRRRVGVCELPSRERRLATDDQHGADRVAIRALPRCCKRTSGSRFVAPAFPTR